MFFAVLPFIFISLLNCGQPFAGKAIFSVMLLALILNGNIIRGQKEIKTIIMLLSTRQKSFLRNIFNIMNRQIFFYLLFAFAFVELHFGHPLLCPFISSANFVVLKIKPQLCLSRAGLEYSWYSNKV